MMKEYLIKGNLGIIVFLLTLLLFNGCGSSSSSDKKNSDAKYSIKESELYAWVNLMPGSKAKFHVTGDVKIEKKGEIDLNEVQFIEVSVYQDDKLLYSFQPGLRDKGKSGAVKDSLESRHLKFSDTGGFEIDSRLKMDQPVKLKFHFTLGTESYFYSSKVINIEKVY
ncbi:MAG: hypothetical protein ACM3MI_04210 [Clostridiales bacterium]